MIETRFLRERPKISIVCKSPPEAKPRNPFQGIRRNFGIQRPITPRLGNRDSDPPRTTLPNPSRFGRVREKANTPLRGWASKTRQHLGANPPKTQAA